MIGHAHVHMWTANSPWMVTSCVLRIVILADFWLASFTGLHQAAWKGSRSFIRLIVGIPKKLGPRLGCPCCCLSIHFQVLTFFSLFLPVKLSFNMPSDSSGIATNANVSRIDESRIPADPLAPVPLIYTATSRRANLLPSSIPISESKILASRQEAAAMKPHDTKRESDVRNAPLPSD